MHWPSFPVLAVVGALSLAGCGDDDESSTAPAPKGAGGQAKTTASAAKVNIADFKYTPPSIKVKRGGSVTFTNSDSAPHTATASDNRSFDTDSLKLSQSKAVTVSKAGTYPYYCVFHPFMKGTLVVE